MFIYCHGPTVARCKVYPRKVCVRQGMVWYGMVEPRGSSTCRLYPAFCFVPPTNLQCLQDRPAACREAARRVNCRGTAGVTAASVAFTQSEQVKDQKIKFDPEKNIVRYCSVSKSPV